MDLGYVLIPIGLGMFHLGLSISEVLIWMGVITLAFGIFFSNFRLKKPLWSLFVIYFLLMFLPGVMFAIAMGLLFGGFILINHKVINEYSDKRKFIMILVGIAIYLLLSSLYIYGYNVSRSMEPEEANTYYFNHKKELIFGGENKTVYGEIEEIGYKHYHLTFIMQGGYGDWGKFTRIQLKSDTEKNITYLYRKNMTDELSVGDKVLIKTSFNRHYDISQTFNIHAVRVKDVQEVRPIYFTAAMVYGICFMILAFVVFRGFP